MLPAEIVPDELVARERARALWLDVDVGEVDADGEEARAEGEEGNGGEKLSGSGRGAPTHPMDLVGDLYGQRELACAENDGGSSRGRRWMCDRGSKFTAEC